MANIENKQFVFKIALVNTWPEIWRRIHIPGNFNIEKLEMLIRLSMELSGANHHIMGISPSVNQTRCFFAFSDDQDSKRPDKYNEVQKSIVSECFSSTCVASYTNTI